jgi:hypothetical protein
MPPLAVSPPAAHRTGGQVRINRDDLDLCVTKKPVDNVLPGRPQPSLDNDAQLDADGGWHQPGEGILKVYRKFFAPRLAEDDRHGRRRIDDKAPPCRFRQRGRPVSS